MNYAVALVALGWIVIGGTISDSHHLQQNSPPEYRVAYERWRRAIDANPMLGDPFWVSTDSAPAELRSAVGDLLSLGPNLTPFLVEEMKSEKDQMRLYQLVMLLNAVSGINLYFGSGEENHFAAMPRFRDRFIQDWNSGGYLNATALLESTWTYGDETQTHKRVDPQKLTQIRRYGVFAIPFIIKSFGKHNSPELFAAFLIITGQPELYTHYLEKPSDFLPERGEKLSYVKGWAGRNERRINKLEGLPAQIKALMGR